MSKAIIPLWDDLSAEDKQIFLDRLEKRRGKVKIRRKGLDRRYYEAMRRRVITSGGNSDEEWRELLGDGGVNILDGWARIFIVTRQNRLLIFKGVRFAEEWLAPLSKDLAAIQAASIWPKGMLPKANPWKMPWFLEVAVLKPQFDEESGQIKVTFPSSPPTTWYISGEVLRYPFIEGYLVPRKQARGRPWCKADGTIRYPTKAKFVPDFTDEDLQMLLDHGVAGKAYVIRRHRRLLREDIKARKLCVMDIKEAVETLLKHLEK